jgi:hypothetical protein
MMLVNKNNKWQSGEVNCLCTRNSMLRASSSFALQITKLSARKFSAAAAESASTGSGLPWALGATVAAITAGAVVGLRSQHSMLLQEDVQWMQKISGGASAQHHDHHGKH